MGLTVSATVLVSCSSPTAIQTSVAIPSVGQFVGPYADAFASHYRDATSEFAKEALGDGEISEAEFTESLSRFKRCLSDSGITMTVFNFDGSYSTKSDPSVSSDEGHAIATRCSRSSDEDLIVSLYTWVRQNPRNEDENKLVAACLASEGVVPSTFTGEHYSEALETGDLPFGDDPRAQTVLASCRMDPLGLEPK